MKRNNVGDPRVRCELDLVLFLHVEIDARDRFCVPSETHRREPIHRPATTGSKEIPSAKRRIMRHTFAQGFLVTSAVLCLAAQSMSTASSRQGNGWQRWNKFRPRFLSTLRGGGGLDPEDDISALIDTETKDGNDDEVGVERPPQTELQQADQEEDQETLHQTQSRPRQRRQKKVRHTSEVIQNLMDRGVVVGATEDEELSSLRELTTDRANDFLKTLWSADDKMPHPNKVLRYVAPRIPAIQTSPDILLRIQSARPSVDAGAAAFCIGTVARICQHYDNHRGPRQRRRRKRRKDVEDDSSSSSSSSSGASSVSADIIKDRRFEQLVECVLCGLNIPSRKRQAQDFNETDTTPQKEIEDVLDDRSLSISNTCRAAWGLAIMGGYNARQQDVCRGNHSRHFDGLISPHPGTAAGTAPGAPAGRTVR